MLDARAKAPARARTHNRTGATFGKNMTSHHSGSILSCTFIACSCGPHRLSFAESALETVLRRQVLQAHSEKRKSSAIHDQLKTSFSSARQGRSRAVRKCRENGGKQDCGAVLPSGGRGCFTSNGRVREVNFAVDCSFLKRMPRCPTTSRPAVGGMRNVHTAEGSSWSDQLVAHRQIQHATTFTPPADSCACSGVTARSGPYYTVRRSVLFRLIIFC